MPSNTWSIYILTNVCLDYLIDTEGRTSASYMYIASQYLQKRLSPKTMGKNRVDSFQYEFNHEHQHNTRKHTKKTLCQKSWKKSPWKKKKQNRKTPRKPQKKREQSPDKKVAWEILSKPLVFVWFSQGFCWLTRIRRQESGVPKTSWNHELCPTPKKKITTAQKLHPRVYCTTFKKNNLSKSHLQICGQKKRAKLAQSHKDFYRVKTQTEQSSSTFFKIRGNRNSQVPPAVVEVPSPVQATGFSPGVGNAQAKLETTSQRCHQEGQVLPIYPVFIMSCLVSFCLHTQ